MIDQEKDELYGHCSITLKNYLNVHSTIILLSKLSSIEFSSRIMKAITFDERIKFDESDVKSVNTKISNMNIIDFSEGTYIYIYITPLILR